MAKLLTAILVWVCVLGFFGFMIYGDKGITAIFMVALPISFILWGSARDEHPFG